MHISLGQFGAALLTTLGWTRSLTSAPNSALESSTQDVVLNSNYTVHPTLRPVLLQQRADSCHVDTYNAPPVGMQDFPPFDADQAIVYRYRQQQSVNLGSWFVHEAWMTPSVFKCASGKKSAELDIASGWGSTASARSVLEKHWDTFITQSDFDHLASIGINTVRLPIGYWMLGSDYCKGTDFNAVADVYQNAWSRVVRAINQAGQSGIGVLVDLHGAVGSQNGQAHSGVSTGGVQLFNSQSNMDKTINVLTFLMKELGSVTNVVGIQLLNEPKNVANLPDFYNKAIDAMRGVSDQAKDFPLVIHDGFDLDRFSSFNAQRTDFTIVDTHSYFVYTNADTSKSATQLTNGINGGVSSHLSSSASKLRRNLIVGEWSCALAPSSSKKESNPQGAQKNYCQSQLDVYSKQAAGWAFWAYKKESCDNGWCFQKAVGDTLPSTFFSYGTSKSIAPEPAAPASSAPASSKSASASASSSASDDSESSTSAAPSETGSSSSSSTPASSSTHASSTHTASTQSTTTNSKSSAKASSTADVDLTNPHRRRRSFGRRHHHVAHLGKRAATTSTSKPKSTSTPAPSSSSKASSSTANGSAGYQDGVDTAKLFAKYGMSKLGFVDQYILDHASQSGNAKRAADSQQYTNDFLKGMSDGETQVQQEVGK